MYSVPRAHFEVRSSVSKIESTFVFFLREWSSRKFNNCRCSKSNIWKFLWTTKKKNCSVRFVLMFVVNKALNFSLTFVSFVFFFKTHPTLLEDELDSLLSENSSTFWENRTINELRSSWQQLRLESKLIDQIETGSNRSQYLSLIFSTFFSSSESQDITSPQGFPSMKNVFSRKSWFLRFPFRRTRKISQIERHFGAFRIWTSNS